MVVHESAEPAAEERADLVEEEDRDPLWLTTLRDEARPGPVRPEIEAIIAAHRDAVPAEEV